MREPQEEFVDLREPVKRAAERIPNNDHRQSRISRDLNPPREPLQVGKAAQRLLANPCMEM